MPTPKAICIEDLRPRTPGERYLRCVAIAGRKPGLGLRPDGEIVWQATDALACELWVSADDRLIAYRPEGSGPFTVRRAGRSLQAPWAKPIVLLDQDELVVDGREIRIHIHGQATRVHGPQWLASRSGLGARMTAVAAAAIALGAAATGCDRGKQGSPADGSIEVREAPPAVAPEPPPLPDAGEAPDSAPSNDAGKAADASTKVRRVKIPSPPPRRPIEVREHPPDPID